MIKKTPKSVLKKAIIAHYQENLLTDHSQKKH